MKNMRKWILGALLLAAVVISVGYWRENVVGVKFWDFIERKCDSLKMGAMSGKMESLFLEGSQERGEG